MKRKARQLWEYLTPAAKVLLVVWTVIGLCTVLKLGAEFIYSWLSLDVNAVRHGRVWMLLTYALVPAFPGEVFINPITLLFLGPWIEKAIGSRMFFIVCAVGALGPGLIFTLFMPNSVVIGTVPVGFGLLAAWAYACGHDQVCLGLNLTVSVRFMALLLSAANFGLNLLGCSPKAGLVCATALPLTWLFLLATDKLIRRRQFQPVQSERMSRIEF